MSYDKTLEYLKKVRDQYSNQVLSQKGVHAIGVRVHDYRIVVYVNDMSPEIIQTIPLFLDDIPVEIVLQEEPPSLNFGGGDRTTAAGDLSYYGTLGSIWFSTKFKQPVCISNNHVFAKGDTLPKRSVSLPVSTVAYSGFGYPEPEVSYFGEDFPNNTSPDTTGARIDSIEIWDGETWGTTNNIGIGQYVLLRGQNFGRDNYFNQNKLFLNGKQSTPYYWSNNAVIFIVPNISGNVEIQIQAEGTRLWVEDRKVSTSYLLALGELLDYCEVTHTPVEGLDAESGITWQWEAEASADVAISTIASNMLPEAVQIIEERASWRSQDVLYNYYMAGQRSHTITGIVQQVKEFMPLMLHGARGTVYCTVVDPNMRCVLSYPKGDSLVAETVMYQYTASTTADPIPFAPSVGGQSGSSVMIADIDNLLDYYNYYHIAAPTREQMENSLKDENNNQIVFTGNFVGNNFAGIEPDRMGFSDIAKNWVPRMEILPISMVPQIEAENSPLAAINTMTVNPTLFTPGSQTELAASASFTAVSSLTVNPTVVTAPTTLSASATFTGVSNLSAIATVGQAAQNIIIDFDLSLVSAVAPNAADFILQLIDGLEDLETNATFTAISTLNVTAGIAPAVVYHQAQATISGSSTFTATGSLTYLTQFEHIYFEITRLQDINTEITRSQDINTEITRTLDINLAV